MTTEAFRPSLARRLLRWTRNLLASLAALLVLALAVVYGVSESIVRRAHAVPAAPRIELPTDPAAIESGRRLAQIHGCTGCHGTSLEGRMLIDEPFVARLAAPDLTKSAARHSDAELDTMIRRGLRPDGRSLFIMPSASYSILDDRDLAAILAYVRSLPVSAAGLDPVVELGPPIRAAIAAGAFEPEATRVARAAELAQAYPGTGDTHARGAYLARTICSACHGLALEGGHDDAPALAVARAYSLADFTRLLRTGIALGDRELGMMSEVSRTNLAHLTDGEIAALHGYLVARAAPTTPPTPTPTQ